MLYALCIGRLVLYHWARLGRHFQQAGKIGRPRVWRRMPHTSPTPPRHAPSVPPACVWTEGSGPTGEEQGGRKRRKPTQPSGKSHGANFRNNKIITWKTAEDFKGQTFSLSKVYDVSHRPQWDLLLIITCKCGGIVVQFIS